MAQPENSDWKNKRVAITGVAGSVGRSLVSELLSREVAEIVGIDNSESSIFFLRQLYRNRRDVHLYMGDLRSRETLIERFRGCEIVMHAAALKHVEICEHSPGDAVLTNILGTLNVLDAGIAVGAERVILCSSDKAVHPTTVMGTSKLMAERLMTAAHMNCAGRGPVCASIRFGNVLGSSGSVIPVFRSQIARGGPVTLTHRDMTRFIMTLGDAVNLVLDAAFLMKGGEVFITKMPAMRILDLAEIMIDELAPCGGHNRRAIKIEEVGVRPGEKMFEELLNDEEVTHTLESSRYFIVLPAAVGRGNSGKVRYDGLECIPASKPYNSSAGQLLSREELREYLKRSGLLDAGSEQGF